MVHSPKLRPPPQSWLGAFRAVTGPRICASCHFKCRGGWLHRDKGNTELARAPIPWTSWPHWVNTKLLACDSEGWTVRRISNWLIRLHGKRSKDTSPKRLFSQCHAWPKWSAANHDNHLVSALPAFHKSIWKDCFNHTRNSHSVHYKRNTSIK